MNNRNGMFKSVLPIAATGVAILGIVRGIRSRSFQPFFQTILSSLRGAAPQVAQGMMGGQLGKSLAQPLQGMMNNQGAQQQPANQQNPQASKGMMGGQTGQNMTQLLQGMMNNQGAQQQPSNQKNPQASQGMMGGQTGQNMTQPSQGTMNNQGSRQQAAIPKNSARQ